MSDIKVQRTHSLGLPKARALAQEWMNDDARQFGLDCTLKQGEQEDQISFERMGAKGLMKVRANAFELEIKLGMMLAAFKPIVESEVDKNLARILAKAEGGKPPA